MSVGESARPVSAVRRDEKRTAAARRWYAAHQAEFGPTAQNPNGDSYFEDDDEEDEDLFVRLSREGIPPTIIAASATAAAGIPFPRPRPATARCCRGGSKSLGSSVAVRRGIHRGIRVIQEASRDDERTRRRCRGARWRARAQ